MRNLAVWIAILLSVQWLPAEDLERHEFTRVLMGTRVRVILYADSSDQALRAANRAFDRISELDRILSDYRSDSEVSRLGGIRPQAVSRELAEVLEIALEVAEESGGAFDPTVGPLTRLWRLSKAQSRLPTEAELEEARARTGYRLLSLDRDRRTVRFALPGMRLDLGGIGKGFAAGEALAELGRAGIGSALIDAGGDIVVSQPPPGEPGWKIALEDPDGGIGGPLILREKAVATSGGDRNYLAAAGQRYSHILNPARGMGVTRQSVVTVIASDGARADAWATAFSVLDPREAHELAAKRKEIQVIRAPDVPSPPGSSRSRSRNRNRSRNLLPDRE